MGSPGPLSAPEPAASGVSLLRGTGSARVSRPIRPEVTADRVVLASPRRAARRAWPAQPNASSNSRCRSMRGTAGGRLGARLVRVPLRAGAASTLLEQVGLMDSKAEPEPRARPSRAGAGAGARIPRSRARAERVSSVSRTFRTASTPPEPVGTLEAQVADFERRRRRSRRASPQIRGVLAELPGLTRYAAAVASESLRPSPGARYLLAERAAPASRTARRSTASSWTMSAPPISSPFTKTCGIVGQPESALSSWRILGVRGARRRSRSAPRPRAAPRAPASSCRTSPNCGVPFMKRTTSSVSMISLILLPPARSCSSSLS